MQTVSLHTCGRQWWVMSQIFSLIPNQVNAQVFLSIPLVFNQTKRREFKKKIWVLQITATQWLKITDYLSYSSILTGPPILTNEMSGKVLTDSLLWVLTSASFQNTHSIFGWSKSISLLLSLKISKTNDSKSTIFFPPLSLCHFLVATFGKKTKKLACWYFVLQIYPKSEMTGIISIDA